MNHLYIKDIIYKSIFLCIIYNIPESENSPRKAGKRGLLLPSISIRQTRVFHIDVAGKPLLWYNYTENHNFSKCAVVFYSTVYFVFSSADTFDVL